MQISAKKIFAALAALSLSGCVSMGKYHALESLNSDLQSQLDATKKSAMTYEKDLGTAKQDNAALSDSKSALEKQKDDLSQQKTAAEKQASDMAEMAAQLKAQKDALQAEKDALVKAAAEKQAQYDSLVGDLKKEVSEGNLKITQYKNMLTVDVADKILFDSGKAAIKADGKAVLQKVGEALAKSDKYIRVVGHTDNVPLSANAAYASNWDLSAARATTVVRFLQEQAKLDPQRLMAAGRGEYAPVAPNDTPANKQKNRRIEITLLDKNLVDAIVDKPADAPAPTSPTAK